MSLIWTRSGPYRKLEFARESDLEEAILEVKDELFGPRRIYLPVKKRIGVKGGVQNIPDGYLIDLATSQPRLYAWPEVIGGHTMNTPSPATILLSATLQTAVSGTLSYSGQLSPGSHNQSPLTGPVIYDNGNTDINSDRGDEMTNWEQADDFEYFGAFAFVTGIEFDYYLTPGGFHDGTIEWKVCFDIGGVPGPPIAGGLGVNQVHTSLGNAQGYSWYNVQFNLDAPVTIDGGVRYWLVLHASSDCITRDNMYWAYSTQQQFNPSKESFECTSPWNQVTAEDRAFSLLGFEHTPVESSTWGAIRAVYAD